jgi:D-aminoacyl-tRNA deacylase
MDDFVWKKRDVRGQHLVHGPMKGRFYVNPRLGHLKIGPEPGCSMEAESVVLIAVNQQDVASTNQADILRELDDWSTLPSVEGNPTYAFRHLRMIYLPDGLLFEDHLERRWHDATGELVSEIIFPSRHVAASGQASLTLHPIGTPHLPLGEHGQYGGYGGSPPPPSTRLAPWWKMLLKRSAEDDRVGGFDVSLEVTHHGPSVDVPCLFIEVGSTEATWGHRGAADVLAHLIRDGLLNDAETKWNAVDHQGQLVLVTLGGGHYAPRANQLAALDGVWLGHMLATYALPFVRDEDDQIHGTWQQSILGALTSTRKAFPGGVLVCSMDKKAFKGWQRQAIRDLLASENVPLLTTRQIKERLGQS